MQIKKAIHRLRAWQKAPRRYSSQNLQTHCCANCGHEFQGNYCPICGQNGDDGQINWRSVWKSFMRVWEMDSRSLPATLVQLLLRPGYFIGEYLDGHRQISHPPMNMLFAVAVIYVIVIHIFGIGNTVYDQREDQFIFYTVTNWLSAHPAWGMISATTIMIFPTWLLFRFAPRHTNHSMPQSIFIQIFMSTLLLVCTCLLLISEWFLLLIPFYYYIAYRQLFGYGFWGTFWRLLACAFFWVEILFTLVIASLVMDNYKNVTILALLYFIIFVTISSTVFFAISYWLSKRAYKKRETKHTTE